MRKIDVVVFLSTALTISGLINSYLFVRGRQALPEHPHVHTVYLAVFLALALSFITGRFLERVVLSTLSSILVRIGAFWLAAMV
jgi:small neutral amino acid transporter SnatA (MarC family)